jgi:hypothetical protein
MKHASKRVPGDRFWQLRAFDSTKTKSGESWLSYSAAVDIIKNY